MGIGAISINYNRIFAVNFLEPHYIDSFTFITNPAAKHIGFDVLMRPFRHEVWFVFFFMLIIASLFQQFEKYMTSITNIVRDQKSSTSKHNIFWINLCLLFRQPYSKLVQINLSLKIFAIIWAISALILTNSYAGCLCSIMALPSEQVIDSVEKLAMECPLKHISTIGINTDYYTSMKVKKWSASFHSKFHSINCRIVQIPHCKILVRIWNSYRTDIKEFKRCFHMQVAIITMHFQVHMSNFYSPK